MKKIEYNNNLVKKTFINKEKIYPSTYNELNRVVIELINNNNDLDVNINNKIDKHNIDKNAHFDIFKTFKMFIWNLNVYRDVLIMPCGNFIIDDCLFFYDKVYNLTVNEKKFNVYVK